jgi:hypothetical protein
MTSEEQEDVAPAVSEPVDVQPQETLPDEPKMVPLAALQAERKKRQESEARTRVYEEMMAKKSQEPDEPEDLEALVTKGNFQEEKALTKREILEQVYQDMNPDAVRKIEMYLKPILDKKPWLAASVDTAQNRLARANEIIDDYIHLLQDKPKPASNSANDAKRIVQNSQKPGSPTQLGKSAQPSGMEYLKSMQGKKEFREYRQKLLNG